MHNIETADRFAEYFQVILEKRLLTSLNPVAYEVLAANSVSCRNMLSASFATSQAVSRLSNAALLKRAGSPGCSSVAVLTELCACMTGHLVGQYSNNLAEVTCAICKHCEFTAKI